MAEYGNPVKTEMSLARYVQRDVDMFKEDPTEKKLTVVKRELNDWKSIFSGAYSANKRRKLSEDVSLPQAPKVDPVAAEAEPLTIADEPSPPVARLHPIFAKAAVVAKVTAPPGCDPAPVTNAEQFEEFTKEVLQSSQVLCAGLFRSGMTSFRRSFKPAPAGKVKFDEDKISLSDSLVGIGLSMLSRPKPVWIPLENASSGAFAVSVEQIWDFFVKLLESPSVEKVIVNVQRLLFEVIRVRGEDCAAFIASLPLSWSHIVSALV